MDKITWLLVAMISAFAFSYYSNAMESKCIKLGNSVEQCEKLNR